MTTTTTAFEAMKEKIRYPYNATIITSEQLFEIPLSRLDTITVNAYNELQELTKDNPVSFLKKTPAKHSDKVKRAELAFNMAKEVLEYRVALRDAKRERDNLRNELLKRQQLLQDQIDKELLETPRNELEKQIEELSAKLKELN